MNKLAEITSKWPVLPEHLADDGTPCTWAGVRIDSGQCPDRCKAFTETVDMAARWLPTDTAVRHARALLDAEPRADLAAIPMVQPGKQRGWWTLGQRVETVPGVVFIGVNGDVEPGAEVPDYSWARAAASRVARAALGDRPGTVAHAVVERDGHVAVFEDF